MKIGVICAMHEEVDLIRKDMVSHTVEEIAGRQFHIGKLYGVDTVLVVSRIGKVASAVTASILIDRFNVEKIVFSGTAGGVDPNMNVGDAVVATSSVQHDFKVPGGDMFRIPLLDISYLPADEELSNKAFDAVNEYIAKDMLNDIPKKYLSQFNIKSPKVKMGVIASGDEFVCSKERNTWLYENVKDIKCVEMEGASVAQVCFEYGIPYTVIRVISDCANNDASVDFDLFIKEAACHFTRGTIKALFSRLV